jgi:hypothetical protein
MSKSKKVPKAKAAAKLKDLKAGKNPAGGVFNPSIKTDLTGGSVFQKVVPVNIYTNDC